MKTLFLVLAFTLVSSVSYAQVVNPTTAAWDHASFSQSTGYEFGYFADATVAQPIQTAAVAKPATCAPCSSAFVLPSKPLGFGVFYLSVRAIAGTALSDWSNRVPFELRLAAPVNLSVK